jgi:hypothetical protein
MFVQSRCGGGTKGAVRCAAVSQLLLPPLSRGTFGTGVTLDAEGGIDISGPEDFDAKDANDAIVNEQVCRQQQHSSSRI